MRQYLRAPALIAIAALTLAGCGQTTTATQPGTVSVTGVAKVQAVPDEFVIHASVNAQGDKVKVISEAVNSRVDKVLALIEQQGVEKKDVTALELRVTPQWQYQPTRKLTGYKASRDLTITTHGTDQYAQTLQLLLDNGINEISRTEARVSNANKLEFDALATAVKDARAKADKLAQAAGREVDQAQTISVSGNSRPAPQMMRAMVATPKASAHDYSPGEITLSQQVHVTFTLE